MRQGPVSKTPPTLDPLLRRAGMLGLKGKNALVTGGSSGIGQAIAVRFAEHGANVAINYLTTPDEAASTERQIHACVRKVRQEGVRDVLVQADVSCEDGVVRMVREATERLGVSTSSSTTPASSSRDRRRSSPARTSTGSWRSTCEARSSAPARRSGDSWPTRSRAS
jgi:5,10-methylene-tetrahydrofolate dehydrogenase/methenyl tetrahydrofolate cyclohydrolase